MNPIDLAVVVAYLLGMAGMGFWFMRRRGADLRATGVGERRVVRRGAMWYNAHDYTKQCNRRSVIDGY